MNNNSICYCGSQCEDDIVFCNECLDISECECSIEVDISCEGDCETIAYIVNK